MWYVYNSADKLHCVIDGQNIKFPEKNRGGGGGRGEMMVLFLFYVQCDYPFG